MPIGIMTNQKERPRAENKGLNNGVAMLDFEDFGYGRKKEGQWKRKIE